MVVEQSGRRHRAWSNFEFIAEDGTINEVDLLVLSPKGPVLRAPRRTSTWSSPRRPRSSAPWWRYCRRAGRQAMTLIADLLMLPEQVHRGDFVLRLSQGVGDASGTPGDYVITEQLAACFDSALGFARSAIE